MSRNRPSKLSRRVRIALSAVMFALTGPISSGLILFNPAVASANSNNGTIKIHEYNTPSGTENNDPKVCKFNVESFNLDSGQTGQLIFETQGHDAPIGVNAGPYAFGPADATGNFATAYYSLQPGHYKATLLGVDGNRNKFNLKSKVFKVECPGTTVKPAPLADIDISCGKASVTVSNPLPDSHEMATSVTLTIVATGHADRNIVLQPGQIVTNEYTFAEDSSGGIAQVQVFKGSAALDPATMVDTDCEAPQGDDTGGGSGGGSGTGGNGGGSGGGGGTGGNGGGQVLGDKTTVPAVTSTPSVLAASTITELPKSGPTNLPALVIALLGSVVAYELSRRKVGQSNL